MIRHSSTYSVSLIDDKFYVYVVGVNDGEPYLKKFDSFLSVTAFVVLCLEDELHGKEGQ